MLLPSIATTIEDIQQMQGNLSKHFLGTKGLSFSGAKGVLTELFTKVLNYNVVTASPEKNSNTIAGSKIKK